MCKQRDVGASRDAAIATCILKLVTVTRLYVRTTIKTNRYKTITHYK